VFIITDRGDLYGFCLQFVLKVIFECALLWLVTIVYSVIGCNAISTCVLAVMVKQALF